MVINSPKLSEFNYDKENVKFGCLVPFGMPNKIKEKQPYGVVHEAKKLNAPAT